MIKHAVMNWIRTLLTALTIVVVVACSSGPQPIDYGNDGCHFCKMTIVDKRYASELITKKGKVFKFDAIECMINFKEEQGEKDQYKMTMVTDYLPPHALIDAASCTYLRSAALPSPMGMYLTGFGEKDSALAFQSENGGITYSWDELNDQFKQLPALHHKRN